MFGVVGRFRKLGFTSSSVKRDVSFVFWFTFGLVTKLFTIHELHSVETNEKIVRCEEERL